MTTRREFITVLGGAVGAAWPVVAWAQADRVRLIGILMGIESGADARKRVEAFKGGLQDLGSGKIEIVELKSFGEPGTRIAFGKMPQHCSGNCPISY
jgi:hypothetical protein